MKKIRLLFILGIIIFSTKNNSAQTSKSGVLRIDVTTDTSVENKVTSKLKMQFDINYNFFKYPDSALTNNIRGKEFFTCTIGADCKIDSIKITKDLGGGLAEITIKILQNLEVEFYINNELTQDCELLEKVYRKNKINSSLNFSIE